METAKREIIFCDKCGAVIGSAPSLDEMSQALPAALRPMISLVPGGVATMRTMITNKLFRCAPCTMEGR